MESNSDQAPSFMVVLPYPAYIIHYILLSIVTTAKLWRMSFPYRFTVQVVHLYKGISSKWIWMGLSRVIGWCQGGRNRVYYVLGEVGNHTEGVLWGAGRQGCNTNTEETIENRETKESSEGTRFVFCDRTPFNMLHLLHARQRLSNSTIVCTEWRHWL